MKRFLLAFVAFFLSFSSFAQVTINGITGDDGVKVVSDSWAPDGFFGSIANTPSFTYSNYTVLGKEHELNCSAEGIVTVSFDMTSGVKYALHIMGVDLLDAEGNVISSDYHYGTAGAANNCNEYSLHVTTDAVKIRYFVENYAPIDTYGEISFVWRGVQGKSHSWSPERWIAVRNIPAEVANINDNFIVPYVRKMETLIELEKGVHLIAFKYSGTTGELRLGGVEVVDSEGNVVCGDYHHASARVYPERAVYSVKVLQNGTYTLRYYCENKSTLNNTEGVVEIHTAEPINISEGGKTGWTHLTKTEKDLSLPFTVVNASCIPDAVLGLDGVEAANVRVCERLITVNSLSSVDVEFQITGGSKAIRFAGVEFIKVSDSDDDADASHYKKMLEDASASSVTRYILAPVEGDYLMRAYAYVENSNIIDSKGDIEFHVDETIIDASVEGLSELKTVDNWDPSSFVKASDVPESISQVSSSNVRIMTALVKLYDVDAKLTVDFEIKSGQRALDVAGVDIVDAFGNVLAKDYHFSSFGGNPGEPYCLSLSSRNFKIGETYLIRFFNGQNNPSSSTRDIDSEGNVKFCVQKKTFEASTLDVSKYYYYIKGENGQYISAKPGNTTLVDSLKDASKFYFKENENGTAYNLISFEAGLYMYLSGNNLAAVAVDSITDLALGKGFGSGKSVLIKAGDKYLTNELGVTTDIDDNISWTLEEVESLSFSISDARYSTLCVPVEVKIPEGVKAYTYGGLNVTEGVGVLNLEKVTTDYLPAYEAVLLFSVNPAGGNFEFALTGGDNYNIEGNAFMGTIVKRTFDQEDGQIFMYLTKVGTDVGFYKRKTMPYTLGANKAYFYLTSEQQAAVSRGMSMRLIDGTTGIEDVPVDAVVEDTIYDLQGRRLDEVTAPGIYIVNGKKMYIK